MAAPPAGVTTRVWCAGASCAVRSVYREQAIPQRFKIAGVAFAPGELKVFGGGTLYT